MPAPRPSRRLEFPAWFVGVVLAGVVALAYVGGLPSLRTAEGALLDWWFRYGRPNPPAPHPALVHVDIDDKSLDSVGRWPWPRARLAEALEVMDEMGARVIAVDILLLDKAEDDAQLEKTLRQMRARVLLAVHGSRRLRPWPELRDLLRDDITLGAQAIRQRLGLSGERARLVRVRLREFKRQVVGETAAELAARGGLTVAAMRQQLLPAGSEILGEFPELNLIRSAVAREAAIRAFARRLPEAPEGLTEIGHLLTPLPEFAEVVHGLGVVNPLQDVDSHVRRSKLRWNYRGRVYPQLGLAAAAVFLEVPASELAKDHLVIGRGDFGRGQHLLSWPRIDFEKGELGPVSHISIGNLLSLHRARQKLGTEAAALAKVRAELLRSLKEDDQKFDPEELEEEVEGNAELWGLDKDQPLEKKSSDPEVEEGRRDRNLIREYLRRRHELAQGKQRVRQAAARLKAALDGKLVFVGRYGTGNFGDFFPTVVGTRTPGVVAHAIIANAALTGYVVRPTLVVTGAIVTLLLGIAAAFAMTRFGPRMAFLVVVLVGTLYFVFNTLVVFAYSNVALATVTPLAGLVVSWAGTQVMRAVRERREKAQLRRQFGSRMSPQLFDFLSRHPDQLHLEGEEREVTCFFSDLAGFTSISESLDSRTTVRILNRYMWEMNRALSEAQGYVNKFLGDGIMAIWGAFDTHSPHAERACHGALECFDRLAVLNRELHRDRRYRQPSRPARVGQQAVRHQAPRQRALQGAARRHAPHPPPGRHHGRRPKDAGGNPRVARRKGPRDPGAERTRRAERPRGRALPGRRVGRGPHRIHRHREAPRPLEVGRPLPRRHGQRAPKGLRRRPAP